MPARSAVLMLVALLSVAAPARADDFSLRDVDKQAHIATSYGLTLTGAAVLRRLELPRWQAAAVSAAVTLALGGLKELVDEPGSAGDMLANGLGAGAAVGVVFALRL